jgi:hypothetical protein
METKIPDNDHLTGKYIQAGNADEVAYWCNVLMCEKEDLIKSVMSIGNSAKMVDDFLILNRRKKTLNGK